MVEPQNWDLWELWEGGRMLRPTETLWYIYSSLVMYELHNERCLWKAPRTLELHREALPSLGRRHHNISLLRRSSTHPHAVLLCYSYRYLLREPHQNQRLAERTPHIHTHHGVVLSCPGCLTLSRAPHTAAAQTTETKQLKNRTFSFAVTMRRQRVVEVLKMNC